MLKEIKSIKDCTNSAIVSNKIFDSHLGFNCSEIIINENSLWLNN